MSGYWLDQQDHTGPSRGWAPFANNPNTYPVYRNAVRDYGARNDGTGDQAGTPGNEGPLQKALNDDGNNGSRYRSGLSYQPAVVYLPGGVYQVKNRLDLRLNTIVIGDPNNPPIIKASSDFEGDTVVQGQNDDPTTTFMIVMKNIIVDTTAIPSNRSITAIQWAVAQGCGLTNVSIIMPSGQTNVGHTGINLSAGSTIAVTDVSITGGLIGIETNNQQVGFKNISFKWCTTGFKGSGGYSNLLQGAKFDTVGLCVDITSGIGSLGSVVLLDCESDNCGPLIKFWETKPEDAGRNNQIAIQKLKTNNNKSPIAVDGNGNTILAAQGLSETIDTWIWGNAEPEPFVYGKTYSTKRSAALLDNNGKIFARMQPIYQSATSNDIVNVKNVPGLKVEGNGSTDDSASLNTILRQNAAAGKISYFPYGVYIVRDTLIIPPNSRLVGEAWSVISGAGSKFEDASNPVPVVQIGGIGETGFAEISEMRFTVSEVLPGAKIVEVNLSGNPGDVGLWNCLITIGGMRDTQVSTVCSNQDTTNSKAAFCGMHLTSSSSAYLENVWGWTADHCVDGGPKQIISTGRGLLVEATKGTWLVGTGFEHQWLYQYNFHNASNVYAGLLQTETPYMQGSGAVLTVPAPWVADARFGDPDYSWCGGDDQTGRTALAVNVSGSCKDLLFCNGAHWAFFTGPWNEDYSYDNWKATVQTNMIRIADNPQNLVWFGIDTKASSNIILDGKTNPTWERCPGGWAAKGVQGGQIIAYRSFAD